MLSKNVTLALSLKYLSVYDTENDLSVQKITSLKKDCLLSL